MPGDKLLEDAERWRPACQRLSEALQLSWEWDPWYQGASSVAPANRYDALCRELATLGEHCDGRSATQAPDDLRNLLIWAGGLDDGQHCFYAPIGESTLYATIRPWTQEATVSVRLGLWSPHARLQDRVALGELLRGWLNI